jgi:23S rRNA (adenine2503-C2)-methyltransferase
MTDQAHAVRTNLVGVPPRMMGDVIGAHVDRPFRTRQVARWIIDRNATAFSEMTDLSKELRVTLARHFTIADPEVLETAMSSDGSLKWLFGLPDGLTVEGVSMPEGQKVTLCLSSQAGCAVGCTFCVTGALGPGRNLRPDEIVGQYRAMLRGLAATVDRVNIVFMGMGEPLLNTGHLGTALETLYERVSPKRITVSTAGILPGIRWLAGLERRPKLAVSLNAPDQERREHLMPISRRYPLTDLMTELRRFPLERGRRITFEYVLIRDLNDRVADAGMVVDLIRGIPCKVNVIPLNEDPEHFPELRRPDDDTINRFAVALRDAGTNVTVRWSKGLDVAAACGQLKGRHQSRATREPDAAKDSY